MTPYWDGFVSGMILEALIICVGILWIFRPFTPLPPPPFPFKEDVE